MSRDLRERVVAAVEGRTSCRRAAERLGVGAASAIRWRWLALHHGTPVAKPQAGNCRGVKTEEHASFILRAIDAAQGAVRGRRRASADRRRRRPGQAVRALWLPSKTALLHAAGWSVNHKALPSRAEGWVERIWRREGLKVPQRQPKRGRLWLNDGYCLRLWPECPGYNFVEARIHDGRKFRILTIIDKASCALRCSAGAGSRPPAQIRRRASGLSRPIYRARAAGERQIRQSHPEPVEGSSEFIAAAVQTWLGQIGVKTLYITPGSPWENGHIESFNVSLHDELLNGEMFYSLVEVRVLVEAWRRHYNIARPHSSPRYRPPAPEAATPPWPASDSASLHL